MSTNHELQVYDLSRSKEYPTDLSGPGDLVIEGSQVNGPDLPIFNFNCVAAATNNFSEENKLGQGGFGPVYKVNILCYTCIRIQGKMNSSAKACYSSY